MSVSVQMSLALHGRRTQSFSFFDRKHSTKGVFGLFILGESHSTRLIFITTHAHGIQRTHARLLGRNMFKQYGGILLAFTEDRYDIETSHVVTIQLFQGCFSITLLLDTSVLAHYLLSTIFPQTTFIGWKGHIALLSAYSAYVPTLGYDLSVSGPSTSARRVINLMISDVTDSVMFLSSLLHLV
jgi:hypothetical protein